MPKIIHRGIDVSEHQGTIDWKRVKNSGIEFVIPRTGFGFSHEDKIFKTTATNAIANGVAIPAVYHFSYACSAADARTEAEFAVDICRKYKLPKSTVIFYDFEDDSNRYFDSIQKKKEKPAKLTPVMVQSFTAAFCERVKELGYKTGVYFNQNWYVNWYEKGAHFHPDYKTWLADLEGEPNYPCDIQQYSFTGRIAGIKSDVDMDYAYYEYKEDATDADEKKEEKKSIDVIVDEVLAGKWGNGAERRDRLTAAGYDYTTIQKKVNEIVAAKNPKKSVTDQVVNDVIAGKYGNGDERKTKLEAEGYVYKEVQDAVNKKLSGATPQQNISGKVSPAQSFDKTLEGKYKVKALGLNLRYIPGLLTPNNVIKVLNKDEVVQCWGYYTQKSNSKWMLIQQGSVTGFCDGNYLEKIN